MAKIKILGTGLSGLVGSRITDLLGDRYAFEDMSFDTGVDIRETDVVGKRVRDSDAAIILHMAAKTDVDGCEKDKALGKEGDAWRVNVLGTKNIVDACKKSGKKIIYISTDFMFDGTRTVYSEEDVPHPTNWYAKTKYEGEILVQQSGVRYIIMRIAYPYRATFQAKKDFVRAVIARLRAREKIEAVVDHIMTPTFIDDIASALDILIRKNATGIYHVVGSQWVTPYEACLRIAKAFGYNESLITETTRAKYFKGRAPRPYNLALNNGKIAKLGVIMRTFEEGLEEIHKQLVANS